MVTVLEDVAFRVDGLRFLEHAPRSCEDVVLDLSDCSLAQGIWALPALDAIAAHLPAARLAVLAVDDLAQLLVVHLRARRHHVVRMEPGAAAPPRSLTIELSPRPTTRARLSKDRERMHVPSRPFPKRRQHAWGHWVDGARACGFDARASRPQLLLGDRSTAAAREARRWLRERFGRRGRTLIALLPSANGGPAGDATRDARRYATRDAKRDATRDATWGSERFAEAGRELETRLDASLLCRGAAVPGATSFDELDIVTAAHVLTFVAVAIGDADSLVHLAAAVGAAAVSLHGATSADDQGAASALGAAISADRCRCEIPRSGCIECIAPAAVIDVAERLAGRRWPWDRLAQLGLVRPLPLSLRRA